MDPIKGEAASFEQVWLYCYRMQILFTANTFFVDTGSSLLNTIAVLCILINPHRKPTRPLVNIYQGLS